MLQSLLAFFIHFHYLFLLLTLSTMVYTHLQKRLMSAAKELAEATAKMVEAAKLCAGQLNDRNSQVRNEKKVVGSFSKTAFAKHSLITMSSIINSWFFKAIQ